jgi:hypothetical protein
MKAILWLVVLATLVAPVFAADGFLNGSALLKTCEGGTNQQAACEGYLQGVSDTLDYVGQTNPAAKMNRSCVPSGTKPEFLRHIFVKYGHMGFHNEQPAASLALVAFTAVWRCTQNDRYKDAYEILGKSLR